jgi:hypothetical protein
MLCFVAVPGTKETGQLDLRDVKYDVKVIGCSGIASTLGFFCSCVQQPYFIFNKSTAGQYFIGRKKEKGCMDH